MNLRRELLFDCELGCIRMGGVIVEDRRKVIWDETAYSDCKSESV